MKNNIRQGKVQKPLGNKNDKESFSIFNNNKSTVKKDKPEWKKKKEPLISKEQRNKLLRALNNGEEIELEL